MGRWLRRVRAAVGVGLTWAVAWFAAGMLLMIATGFDADVPVPLLFALLGFVAGVSFSAILAAIDGRRKLEQMSIKRFAGSGAVGGIMLSGLFGVAGLLAGENIWGDTLMLIPIFATAGAVSAAGSVALARKAQQPELLEAPANPLDADLAQGDRRHLPR